MGSFRRRESGIEASLEPVEVTILHQVVGEVFELVKPEVVRSGGEQWARELGLGGLGLSEPGEPAAEPDDPITARLFPSAYQGDDDASGDFRRFTEPELRAGKAAHAQRMLTSLPEGGGTAVLDEDDCTAWLGALNDARIALGTALEVTGDVDFELLTLEADEVRAQRLVAYSWLGELQELLLRALMRE